MGNAAANHKRVLVTAFQINGPLIIENQMYNQIVCLQSEISVDFYVSEQLQNFVLSLQKQIK